jgi:hypothetical protein
LFFPPQIRGRVAIGILDAGDVGGRNVHRGRGVVQGISHRNLVIRRIVTELGQVIVRIEYAGGIAGRVV